MNYTGLTTKAFRAVPTAKAGATYLVELRVPVECDAKRMLQVPDLPASLILKKLQSDGIAARDEETEVGNPPPPDHAPPTVGLSPDPE